MQSNDGGDDDGVRNNVIVLSGAELTCEQVYLVSCNFVKVVIHIDAWERLIKAREFLFEFGNSQPVYGLNTGLGGAKDKVIGPEFYAQYNREVILSHCTGIEPEAQEHVVRAGMLTRLNTLLVGCTGVQPAVAQGLADFLNQRIHPVVPERGSVGCADITCLSHIGLGLIGEGEVMYKGKRRLAAEAISEAGLKAVVLGPKDGLAILSSNAWSAGLAAITLWEIKKLINTSLQVVCLSLEGFHGHLSPIDAAVTKARGFVGQQKAAEIMRKNLENSYLWEKRENDTLQDPLSFRCACHAHGALLDAVSTAEKALHIQLNSSDDNPCLLLEERDILSCGNFDALAYVLPFQALGVALAHVSRAATHRIIKLHTPFFSKLNTFLSPTPDFNIMGYGILEHSASSIDAEVRHLANPVSIDFISCSIGMEDQSSNGPFVVRNIAIIVDNIYHIMAVELLLAAQATDLRGVQKQLANCTNKLFSTLRSIVPFLNEPRTLHIDVKKAYELLKRY